MSENCGPYMAYFVVSVFPDPDSPLIKIVWHCPVSNIGENAAFAVANLVDKICTNST